jgi:ATP-binding cassette subfamily C protein
MNAVLLAQLRPARPDLVRLGIVTLLAGAPSFATGVVVARALDTGFLAGHPVTGLTWLAALAAIGVGATVAARAQLPLMARVVEPLRERLARLVIEHGLARVVADDSRRTAGGEVAVRATEHVETVRSLITALMRSALGVVVALTLALAGLLVLAPLIAAVVLILVAVVAALYVPLTRRAVKHQRIVLVAEEQVGASSQRLLTAVRDVAAFGATESATAPLLSDVDRSATASRHVARIGSWRSLVPALAIQVPVLVLLALAPWLSTHAGLSTGDLVGAVIYLVSGLAPAVGFLTSAGAGWFVQLTLVSGRLATDLPDSAPVGADLPPREANPSPGDLHLAATGLVFAYSSQGRPVLDGVDLDVPCGRHLAVVGPSGAGKSTLAALLAGVRTPGAGTVTLSGTPIGDWDVARRHRTIAYVPQESYVFAGTVRENLCYLADRDDSAVLDAVDRFGLGPAVERLGGLDGAVDSGGHTLSAGERQLIGLVRVWLSSARVILLDEATCHLDPAAEAAAEALLRERGGTLIVVAHRISSAMRADAVTIVDSGRLHTATHDELRAADERYAALVDYWNATLAR